jgi:hypothetical protein
VRGENARLASGPELTGGRVLGRVMKCSSRVHVEELGVCLHLGGVAFSERPPRHHALGLAVLLQRHSHQHGLHPISYVRPILIPAGKNSDI